MCDIGRDHRLLTKAIISLEDHSALFDGYYYNMGLPAVGLECIMWSRLQTIQGRVFDMRQNVQVWLY